MNKVIKLKEQDLQRIVKRTLNEQDNKEGWKNKLHQRLWRAIEYVDNERETEAAVKLSNEDVVEILQSIIDSLSPIQHGNLKN